jgi:hypothetical protein
MKYASGHAYGAQLKEHLNEQLPIVTGQGKLVSQSPEMSDSSPFDTEWYWEHLWRS